VRFEPRTLDDIRTIVQPDPENERRFATVRRISEINLGLYRSMLQPFIKAAINQPSAGWLKKLKLTELPFQIFSERNPYMPQVANLAQQVREQRQPAAPDNPLLKWQGMVSNGIIAALDGYRDQRDSAMEKMFLAIYSSPVMQAMVGLGAGDESPRPRPGLAPERVALIKERIAELKAGVAEGGPREAAIRALVYAGMAGPGIDERAFDALRHIRAEHDSLTLESFKQTLRKQYFCLLLDPEGALAAIPKMLPPDAAKRTRILDAVRRIADAAGTATGERAARLGKLEQLFRSGAPAVAARSAPRQPARLAKS
jgi:hypothetical protein